jgi:protein-S-isoprenylcysteine O-methyltransferase Ste14
MECSGLLSDSWVVFGLILGCGAVIGAMALGPRMRKEDAMLKEKFGKQWDQWALKVPYKLFPGTL